METDARHIRLAATDTVDVAATVNAIGLKAIVEIETLDVA
jgi:hypothetical protein